jgi:sulfur-oxidizing protein SoxY
MKRRTFLQSSLAGGAVAVAVGAGLLSPTTVLAAAWPKAAFSAKSVQDAMSGLFGNADSTASDAIKIKAPDIAENGAVVPVSVNTSIAGVNQIALITEKNANPLACSFEMGSTTKGFISTRLKMSKTSDVIAVVQAGGKRYAARKNVKVTIGGCGG